MDVAQGTARDSYRVVRDEEVVAREGVDLAHRFHDDAFVVVGVGNASREAVPGASASGHLRDFDARAGDPSFGVGEGGLDGAVLSRNVRSVRDDLLGFREFVVGVVESARGIRADAGVLRLDGAELEEKNHERRESEKKNEREEERRSRFGRASAGVLGKDHPRRLSVMRMSSSLK